MLALVVIVVFGAALGLIPAIGEIELEPEVVLLLFLPAILYWESLNVSVREIRANFRVIMLSAVVLVIVTAAAVAGVAMALGMDPKAAWVLGAVLAPTDAAAIAGLAKRMPRRTLTTLRAESLINDGTALVLFAVAVSVATGEADPGPGSSSAVPRLLRRGIAAGCSSARGDRGAPPARRPAARGRAERRHAVRGVPARRGGALQRRGRRRHRRAAAHHRRPADDPGASRVQAYAFWDLATFLVNGSLFVLVGVQVPGVVDDLEDGRKLHALWVALVLTASSSAPGWSGCTR